MPLPLAPILEDIGNRVLRLDPETRRRLGEMQGKVILLRLLRGDGAPLEVFVLPSEAGLQLRTSHNGAPDVTIAAELGVFLRMGLHRATNQPLAAGEVKLSGDIELGQRFQRVLGGLDIDWEEPLARLFGDVVGHQLGRVLRHAAGFGRHVATTLAQDVTEYLQEESRLLATRAQVEAFLNKVDTLRADAERLEKRVQRLAGLA